MHVLQYAVYPSRTCTLSKTLTQSLGVHLTLVALISLYTKDRAVVDCVRLHIIATHYWSVGQAACSRACSPATGHSTRVCAHGHGTRCCAIGRVST